MGWQQEMPRVDQRPQEAATHEPVEVRVRFFGVYRELWPGQVVQLSMPATATLRDLLKRLADMHERSLGRLLLTDDGQLHQAATLAIGDRILDPDSLSSMLRELAGQDASLEILFIQGMAGGAVDIHDSASKAR